jgi:Tol biopolymer transport system component
MDGVTSRPLEGSENARYPFWSPDSRFIGFFADQKLKKTRADGGPVQIVCDARYGVGGTWNRDDVIVFAPDFGSVLYRVSADGGATTPVTTLDVSRKEGGHVAPFFLPDGKHFFYGAAGGVNIGALDSPTGQPLVDRGFVAQYAPPAHGSPLGSLLYIRDNTLLAQPFDAGALKVMGTAVPVAEGEIQTTNVGAPFSVDGVGMLAYRSLSADRQLTWFDRSGTRTGTLGEPGRYNAVEIAPDDTHVAVEQLEPHGRPGNIWLFGPGGEAPRALTLTGANHPRWDRSGRSLLVQTAGPVARVAVDGSTNQESIYRAPDGQSIGALSDWSPDGRLVAVRLLKRGVAAAGGVVAAVRIDGGAAAPPMWQTEGWNARFSPDGRWIAYSGEETGVAEVYVQPFPGPGATRLISRGGGIRPRWRSDGRELFFVASGPINGTGRIMAASIDTSGGFRAGPPVPIVDSPMTPRDANDYPYAVSANGQRILVLLPVEDPARTPIAVVLNWSEALKPSVQTK